MANVLNLSYARGVADTLVRTGLLKVASVEQAQDVADYVGANLPFDVSQMTAEKVAEIAAAIIEVTEKVAGGTGTLITGDNASQQNTAEASAQHSPLGALDLKNRGVGEYAMGEKGVGKTEFKAPAGAQIGVEQPHPKAPGTTDSKPNSVNTFQVKGASLNALIRKIAGDTGTLVTGDNQSQANTPENAASQVGALAALDEKQRPQGSYAKGEDGVGKTDMSTASGEVGSESAHDKAPGNTDSKPNSLNDKAAAYMSQFEATARAYLPRLAGLSEDEKVAAVQALMALQK